MRKRMRFPQLCTLVLLAALAGCGGTGGDDATVSMSTPDPIEGLYSGSIQRGGIESGYWDLQLLVLENGEYWGLYGANENAHPSQGMGWLDVFPVGGILQGNATWNGIAFTPTNMTDFGTVPPLTESLDGVYVTNRSEATIIVGTGTSYFVKQIYDPMWFYIEPPFMWVITNRNWNLTALDGSPVSLSVSDTGAFTGSTSGCSLSGTITPRPSGRNVLNVALTFGGPPCALPNETATGVALVYNAPSLGWVLTIATVNASRTSATFLRGGTAQPEPR